MYLWGIGGNVWHISILVLKDFAKRVGRWLENLSQIIPNKKITLIMEIKDPIDAKVFQQNIESA